MILTTYVSFQIFYFSKISIHNNYRWGLGNNMSFLIPYLIDYNWVPLD